MDWCGHGLQLLNTNWHDGNGFATNMWNYLPPNIVLAILWLPNEPLNLDANAHPLSPRVGLVGSWRLECTLTRFVTWLLSSLEMLESDHFRKWTSEIHVEEKHPVSWCKENPGKHVMKYFGLPSFFWKPSLQKYWNSGIIWNQQTLLSPPTRNPMKNRSWIFQSSPWEFTAWKAFSPF